MNIIDFLVAVNLGLLGINTVFISIIYSMLPLHIKRERGMLKRWSIYPREIVEMNFSSFTALFLSLPLIFLYILLNQSFGLQNQILLYIPLGLSVFFILNAIILFYKSINVIRKDIISRSNEGADLLYGTPEERKELLKKYNIELEQLPPLLSIPSINTIIKELRYFEKKDNDPKSALHILHGLSQIYNDEIPIQRFNYHLSNYLNIENNKLETILKELEEKNYVRIDADKIKLIKERIDFNSNGKLSFNY